MNRVVILMCLIALAGCEKKTEFEKVEGVKAPDVLKPVSKEVAKVAPKEMGSSPAVVKPNVVRFKSPEEYGKTGPLLWSSPESWKGTKPASTMRLAEYTIAAKDGAEPVSMTAFYFGRSQGGDVQSNVDRWVGQFSTADGKSVKEQAKKEEKKVNGMSVHTVDVEGTYNPGMSGGNRPPKPDQRMLGAIVETESGRFFFKLVGPKDGVKAEETNFESFVNSFKAGS